MKTTQTKYVLYDPKNKLLLEEEGIHSVGYQKSGYVYEYYFTDDLLNVYLFDKKSDAGKHFPGLDLAYRCFRTIPNKFDWRKPITVDELEVRKVSITYQLGEK
jgi:hypothetical protein